MSQKTIYTCDQDGEEIGKKKHISLQLGSLGSATGIAIPAKTGSQWHLDASKLKGFLHFHNGTCLGRYFNERMKEAK